MRNDNGYWQNVESYVKEHTKADFSHGICPDCKVKYFPQAINQSTPVEKSN
ncbi:MAG: hypothetical protein QME52_09085 [Bacteroidota bacterium]|nr:hypothetical protein [Bacteroidota bacterium]